MRALQLGLCSHREDAILALLSQILKEPFFDTLRTKEQLGYVVWSGMSVMDRVSGIRFLVQSKKAPECVDARIEAFLAGLEAHIADLGDGDFTSFVDAVIAQKVPLPASIVISALFGPHPVARARG